MKKSLLFYVIDERTDDVKYCRRKGLMPYKFEDKILDNQVYKSVVQYSYKGHIYDVLEADQCYSGYMVTLMLLPQLSYEELLNTALTSNEFEERIGAVGIILKDYPKEFERYLLLIKCNNNDLPEDKNIKRMVILINDFIRKNTSYVWHLEKILSLCEELELQLK